MKRGWQKLLVAGALCGCLVHASLARSQQLTVQSDTGKQVVLERAEIDALSHVSAKVNSSGSTMNFEGVLLRAVLEKAGVSFAEPMKGKRLASCLLVGAADDYHVVIALAEIDPAFTDKQIILAFTKDGKPLDSKEGPYRIVIPEEKRMARWVRQVTTLKIVAVQ